MREVLLRPTLSSREIIMEALHSGQQVIQYLEFKNDFRNRRSAKGHQRK